ncbi:MAG: class I SAM-dependent methyltransferase [Promethearchaeota archaeon]|jgi:ubiquinone/menaquinone biosynthesis C-methylase UbiE
MKNRKTVEEYAELQYRAPHNLTKRMNLWSYGLNPESFQKWIFSKIQIQDYEQVLELGCGTGQLWLENSKDIPSTSSIVLSDFSKEMVNKAKENLQPLDLPLKFEIIDAETIPYPNQVFDVVIGCHMLFHVPDIEKALRSINRVLKPGGRFISTTISQKHIRELKDLLSEFGLYSEGRLKLFNDFRTETGRAILRPFFSDITFYEYINPVIVNSADPIMGYIESMFPVEKFPDFQEKREEVEGVILKILEKRSTFKITGISGLFEARKPITVDENLH